MVSMRDAYAWSPTERILSWSSLRRTIVADFSRRSDWMLSRWSIIWRFFSSRPWRVASAACASSGSIWTGARVRESTIAETTITITVAMMMNIPDAPAIRVKIAVPMPSSSAKPAARLRALSPTLPSLKRSPVV
jgi:hypothetical protein